MILTEKIPGKILIPIIFSTLCFFSVLTPFQLIPFVTIPDSNLIIWISISISVFLGLAGMISGIKYSKIYRRPLYRLFTISGLMLGAIMSLLLTVFISIAGYWWVKILIYRLNINLM